MAMFTLAQAKELSQDKLTNYVIDEFRKSLCWMQWYLMIP